MKTFKNLAPLWIRSAAALAGISILVALLSVGCQKPSGVEPSSGTLSGTLLSHTGCKTEVSGYDTTSNLDCVSYAYDGRNVLYITHINAGFNCCPGTISADFRFQDGTIDVFESESEAACLCDCLFDVDYRITGLSPGVYRIKFHEPYVRDDEDPLEFRIRLLGPTSGIHCVERHHYPWGD